MPPSRDLEALGSAAESCQGCDLYRDATQTVFGNGSRPARVFLLGEQPGDAEDRAGEPFVGPSGKLLNRAMAEAGLDEYELYRTNAVKHFHWRPAPGGGKRRIHQPPEYRHIVACRPWALAELAAVRPDVVVALGASAGKSLFGSGFRVGEARGRVQKWSAPGSGEGAGPEVDVVATVHPSAILRAPDREAAFEAFVSDLRFAAERLADQDR